MNNGWSCEVVSFIEADYKEGLISIDELRSEVDWWAAFTLKSNKAKPVSLEKASKLDEELELRIQTQLKLVDLGMTHAEAAQLCSDLFWSGWSAGWEDGYKVQ